MFYGSVQCLFFISVAFDDRLERFVGLQRLVGWERLSDLRLRLCLPGAWYSDYIYLKFKPFRGNDPPDFMT